MRIIVANNVLFISIIAAVWILLILLTRSVLGGKIYRKCFIIGWLVVLLRMLCPFCLTVSVKYPWEIITWYETLREIPFSVLVWIWGFGVCVCGTIFLIRYILAGRMLREAIPIQKVPEIDEEMFTFMGISVYVSDRIPSPITYGMLEQKVLLPKYYMQLNREQLKYILIHEKVHIDSHDNLKKFFAIVAVCVHWFNPVVWLMYVCFNRDMELSCDEKVVRQVGKEHREDYAGVLISLAEMQLQEKVFSDHVYSGFLGSTMRQRIILIMKYRHKRKWEYGLYPVVLLLTVMIFMVPVYSEEKSVETTKEEVHYDAVDVEEVVEEDKMGTKIYAVTKTKEDIPLCIKIYPKKGFATVSSAVYTSYVLKEQEWEPGIPTETQGTVTIPEAVRFRGEVYPMEVIGTHAFYRCQDVTQFILPDTVIEIKEAAFEDCISLRQIQLSAKLETMEVNPFKGCVALEKFDMPENVFGQYLVEDGMLYTDYGRFLKICPQGYKKKKILLDDDVVQVANSAFYGVQLEEIRLPGKLQRVKGHAFHNCAKLQRIYTTERTEFAGNALKGAYQAKKIYY